MRQFDVGGTLYFAVLLFIVSESLRVRGFHLYSSRRKGRCHIAYIKTSSSVRETSKNMETNLAASVSEQESKFKILTCMSTACCRKRTLLGTEPLETFVALFARATCTHIQVEESPCLGSCQLAPCVGVEHEDYVGRVALEGMTNDEFAAKA
jgi:hypothetical protein